MMEMVEIQEDDTKKLYEASIRGCVATLNTLLQRDELILDRTSLTFFKETPLHISCLLGHLDFTKAILGHKPRLASVLDSQGHSPLHSAAAEGHTEIVNALLIVNSDACLVPNQHGLIPLHFAAVRGRIEVVQELVRACPDSVQVKLQGSKETVMHLCVKYNQIDDLKLLVRSMNGDRESLNSADSEGNTIWQLALMMKQVETIRFLASIPEVRVETDAFPTGFSNHPLGTRNLEIQDFVAAEPPSTTRLIQQKHEKTGPAQHVVFYNGGQTAAEPTSTTRLIQQKHEKTGPAQHVVLYNGGQTAAESKGNELTRYLDKQSKWIKNTRGQLMIVATFIASMAFQVSINPPGGAWQEDVANCTAVGKTCKAGKSVLGYTDEFTYHLFISSNTVCFCASLGIIFLLIGFPLKNRFTMGLLLIASCTTMLFTAGTYIAGVVMVGVPHDNIIYEIAFVYVLFWVGLLLVIFVYQVVRILFWVVEKFFVGLFYCLVFPFWVLWKLTSKVARMASADERPANRV